MPIESLRCKECKQWSRFVARLVTGFIGAELGPLGPTQAQVMSVLVTEPVTMAISSSRLLPVVSKRLLALRSQ